MVDNVIINAPGSEYGVNPRPVVVYDVVSHLKLGSRHLAASDSGFFIIPDDVTLDFRRGSLFHVDPGLFVVGYDIILYNGGAAGTIDS